MADDVFTYEDATQPTTFSWEDAQGQHLRQELAKVRREPAALSDPNAPAPSPVSTFQGASETTLMPAGEEYRQFRLPRAGAPGIQPVTTFQGPSEVTLQPEQQARTTGEILQNTAAAGVEGIVNPMTPPVILGTIAAPEIVIPAFTAQMGKSGSQKLAEGIVDLQQGRHEEGVTKLGEAGTELGMAAAPGLHPSGFARATPGSFAERAGNLVGRRIIAPTKFALSLNELGREPVVAPPAVTEGIPQPAVQVQTPSAAQVVAGEHPLLAAARIVEQAAGRVEASGQVPAQTVANAIAKVRAALEQGRQQAAAIGQQPAAVAGEAIAGGVAAPASAADAAYAAANAALDRADAIVAGAGAPRTGELPPVESVDVANALTAAVAATRQFHATVNQPQQQEAQNASSQQKAAEVYGDLRPRPVEGEGPMPVSQGGGGVQPQAGEPTIAGIRGGDQAQAPTEVPLDPLDALRAKRAAGEPITAADIDEALRGTAEPPPEPVAPEPAKPPFRPTPPEPARPPRLPGKPVPTEAPKDIATQMTATMRESLGEMRDEVSDVRYGKPGEILFEFKGKTYSAPEPTDVMPAKDTKGTNEEASRSWALKQVLQRKAVEAPAETPPAVEEAAAKGDAESPKPAPAKEPWQMTREQFVGEYKEPYSVRQIQEAEKRATGARQRFNRRTGPMVPPTISGEISGKISAQEATAETMREAYRTYVADYKRKATEHYEAVSKAVRAGRDVPPEVLADYADLAPPEAKPAPTRGAVAKAQKPTAQMTAAEINRELDKLSEHSEKITDKMIAAGRGSERPSDYLKKTDPLSVQARDVSQRISDLQDEIGLRYGPRAPSRLPIKRGFWGPREKPEPPAPPAGAAPSPFFPRRSEAQGLGEPALQPTVEDVRRQRAIDQTGVPPPATPEGPGAATPAEFDPTKPFETSIKNAVTAAKRATRGMPAVEEEAARARPEVWEKVKAEIAEDPGLPDRLVAELRDKPRAITDREDAILLHQQISLEELFNRTTQDMVRLAETKSEAIPEYRVRLGQLSDQLLELYDVDKSAGRETARGLAARKMLADETYSLVRMEMAKRAMNEGRPLTDTERSEITTLKEKIDASQKAFDEHVAKTETRIRELEAQHAADELKIAAAREAKSDAATGTVRDLGAERDSIVAGLGQRANTPLSDLRPWIRKLALNLVRSGVTERNALINAVHDVLKDIFPAIERRDTMDAISGYGDFRPLDPEAAKAKLRDLSGQMQNVSKLEDLLGRRALQKTGPERKTLSDEERRLIKLVNEYKKRYGVVVTDPATQLKSALAAVKTRLTNQIKDLEFQIGTGKKIIKGNTKVAYDAEATALLARRDALKAQFDEVFGNPELTDAQRIEMATKALEKSIENLQQRIATGDIGPRRTVSKTPVTPELESLRQQRDMAREQLQALRDLADPKKTPEEISLAALKTRLLNANFELHRRITEGDFTRRTRRSVTLDPESQRLKAENLRLRENFQRDLLKDRLKNRTPAERWQDNLLGFRRFQLLSSPITLAKLTSAAVQRMIFSPIEEAIGAGLGRIPGVLAVSRRAPIEGGFSAAAESKAMTSAFTKGMSDAVQTAKTGKSELDLLYGGRTAGGGFKEGALMPPSWMEFFGRLHGALKAPVKRAAFERAMQKQFEFGIRNGIDVTNPITQMSYGVQAFKAGERSIFLQDNVLVSKINSFLATRIDPRTGRPTPATKAIATAGRVLLPIVRVPTNIVAETMQYATGLATGNVRLGLALRRGIETLQPEEADLIMRQLKKGSIGSAMLIAGYLLPEFIGGYYQPHEKRPKGDVKVGYIGSMPQYVLHNPLLETLQFGSTVRRVADSSLTKRHPQEQGVTAGVLAGTLGLAEEVPALREIIELNKVFDPRERADYFGELTKSMVVPQAVQWLARQMDKDSAGEVIPRKPGTVLEHIQTGIPGQRENVPEPKRRR